MTTNQRLRLVLVLGVVNLVLATVALGVGLTSPTSPPGIGAVPTPVTALASPVPATPGAPRPTPAASRPATNPTPGRPEPSIEPSPVPSLEPSLEPSAIPSVEPSAIPSEPATPLATAPPTRAPVAVVGHRSTPTPTPAKPQATPAKPQPTPAKPQPTPTGAPVAGEPGKPGCHASERGQTASNGKACPPKKHHKPPKTHHDNGRHNGQAARQRDGGIGHQQATVETRPESKSRRRLRAGRRTR